MGEEEGGWLREIGLERGAYVCIIIYIIQGPSSPIGKHVYCTFTLTNLSDNFIGLLPAKK